MRYLNKCIDDRNMVIKWACMSMDVKSGDFIQGKTILINIEKLNECVFYPIKKGIVVDSCEFIGSSNNTNKKITRLFNKMRDKRLLSITLKSK